MVFKHGKGQYNNWCECAGVSGNESQSACEVMSIQTPHPGGAAYILFRSINKCCRLSDWEHGFGPIRPDWLTRPANATRFLGQHMQGNRTCFRWSNPNHGNPLMVADDWSQDANGVPCSYTDMFSWWAKDLREAHNLTFDASSYSTTAEHDGVFSIPAGMDCSRTCPNLHTWCFFTTVGPG